MKIARIFKGALWVSLALFSSVGSGQSNPVVDFVDSLNDVSAAVRADGAQQALSELQLQRLQHCNSSYMKSVDSSEDYEARAAYSREARHCFKLASSDMALDISDRSVRNSFTGLANATLEQLDENELARKNDAEFRGMKLGLGFAVSISTDEAIEEAVISNGVIVAQKNKKLQPRLVLEFHQLRWCGGQGLNPTKGCGFFAAVSATDEEIVKGIGAGWMWGWRAPNEKANDFSIGLGVMVDSDVKDLADGFNEGQALPGDETEIRYETESRVSGIIMFTRSF